MSKELTPIFLLVQRAKLIPKECLFVKKRRPLTDFELVERLLQIIQLTNEDRLALAGKVKELESHILKKYGEIYQSDSE